MFYRGQHAYFESAKTGRVSRLADPCHCRVDQFFAGIPYIGGHPSILLTLAYVVLALGCFL